MSDKKDDVFEKFDALVNEALALYRELTDASNRFHDSRDEKMSAKGYLAEALANARCNLATIEKLDKTLPEDGNADLLRFLSTATRQAAEMSDAAMVHRAAVTGARQSDLAA